MANTIYEFGDLLQRSLEDHFPAPDAAISSVQLTPAALIVEPQPSKQRAGRIAVFLFGLLFATMPAVIFLLSGEFQPGMVCFTFVGLLFMTLAAISGQQQRLRVTREGVWRETSTRRQRTAETFPVHSISQIRFTHTQSSSKRGASSQWRVGALLDTGTMVGLLQDYDRGRARAVAELAQRLLQEGADTPIPLVDRTQLAPASIAGDAFADAPASRPDFDATLIERAELESASAPPYNPHIAIEHQGQATTFTVRQRHLGRTLGAALPWVPFALIFTLMGGGFSGFLVWGAFDPQEPLTPALRLGRVLLALIPLVFCGVGLLALQQLVLVLLGREYLRVESNLLERGIQFAGRRWRRRRYGLSAIEDVRLSQQPFMRSLVLYDGGKPHDLGIYTLAEHDAQWLADAVKWAVREAARSQPAGAPAGWPYHPRITVEERGQAIEITPRGIRWGWLLGGLLIAGALLVVGLVFSIALPYLAWTSDMAPAERIFSTLFVVVPLGMAYAGASIIRGIWIAFARGSNVHSISSDELLVRIPGVKQEQRVGLQQIRRVKVDHGNVLLTTEQGDVTLAFHRLSRPEDLEWARAAVEYAIQRYRPLGLEP